MSTSPVQVAPEHYDPDSYEGRERLSSYIEQILLARSLSPRTVLEIGPGTGFTTDALRKSGIQVTTVDIDATRAPDLVAGVEALPLPDGAMEGIVCFQVLEHLPFERLGGCLKEMARVTSDWVLVSVPDCRPVVRLELGRGWAPARTWRYVWSGFPWKAGPKHHFDGQHYWEIGKAETPESVVVAAMGGSDLAVERHYRFYSNPYHHFFLLRKRKP